MRPLIIKNGSGRPFPMKIPGRIMVVPGNDSLDLSTVVPALTITDIMIIGSQIEVGLNDVSQALTVNDGTADLIKADGIDYVTPSFIRN